MPEYENLYAGIVNTWANIQLEKHKTRGMRIIKRHLLEFDKQVVSKQPTVQARELLLQRCTFMRPMTDQILVELGEYFESVRDEAQSLLLCMSQRFFPAEISFTQDELDMAHMVRANITHGWQMNKLAELKEAAAEESKMIGYLFSDA